MHFFLAISLFLFVSISKVNLAHGYQGSNQIIETISQGSRISGPSNFYFESFKQEILKEFRDEIRQKIRDMVAEMIGKMPFGEEDSETRTVLGEPLKEKALADPTESKWIKDMKRQMDQLQTAMKKHGLNSNFANLDLDLEEEVPLPPKYKFPNMRKYSSIDDPYLHLKQYVTYIKATGLSKAQIVQ